MMATRGSHYIVAMPESARAPEQRLRPFAGFPEELVSEILLRLPAKSVLRCRAVCKDWRRITSDGAFLLAHHRRQPPRRLLSFVRDVGRRRDLDYCIETLDLHTNQLRSVDRFIDSGLSHYDDSPFKVYAACDGLLLMSYYTRLHLWNPATRQWCSAYPPAPQHDTIMGLYAHGCSHSSREYRVLYYLRIGVAPRFYINIVGSENERVIWPETSSGSVTQWLRRGPLNLRLDKPCLFSNNLHWPPCSTLLKCLLVFDTVAEVFQWLQGPTELGHITSLLEMEGTLAISSSNIGGSEVDLWLLQDYKSAIWVLKYRIKLPVLEIRSFDQDAVTEGDVPVDEDGETDADWLSQVVSPEGDVLVDVGDLLLHYDIKGNMLQKFHCDGRMLNFTTHILQESLVPHTFFTMQEDGNAEEPPFFRWL